MRTTVWRAGVGLLLLAGCAAFGPQMEAPSITISSLRLADSTFLEQRFLTTLRVQNPNEVDLAVEGVSYALEVNGQPFAKGVGKGDVVIPAFGHGVIETEAITTLMAFVRQVRSVDPANRGKVGYRLTGKLKLKDRAASLPFEMRGDDLFGGVSPAE